MRGATKTPGHAVVLRPLGTIAAELGWFFAVDDGRRTRPYFDQASARQLAAWLRVPEHDARQEPMHRRIRRWVVAVDDPDAGVLQAAYAPRAWPAALRDELGKYTGIVVRLASAMEWPGETWAQDLLEIRVACRLDAALVAGGPEVFAVFRTAAVGLLSHALAAYVAVRGSSPAFGGVRP